MQGKRRRPLSQLLSLHLDGLKNLMIENLTVANPVSQRVTIQNLCCYSPRNRYSLSQCQNHCHFLCCCHHPLSHSSLSHHHHPMSRRSLAVRHHSLSQCRHPYHFLCCCHHPLSYSSLSHHHHPPSRQYHSSC